MNSRHFLSCVAVLLLAACASQTPAPIETRTPAGSAASSSSEAAAVRPGYYIVKKGDTLYSIALEHGHDYRDVAAWNGIENPSLIRVGQELRVTPPGSSTAPVTAGAAVTPVPAPTAGSTQPVSVPRIEIRPVDSPSAAPKPAAGAAVTEPRGGRIAYSEKAWAELQSASAPLATPVTAPATVTPPVAASAPVAAPAVRPQPVPAAASEPKPAPRPEAANPASKPGDDKVEWAWPSAGKIIAPFNESTNKGLDFGGALGDPVYAAASGKVIYAGSDLRGYGNLVIIKHGSQYTTVYAHNKEILVKEQQQVQKGQKIAVMGDSDAERVKLHFEMRQPGGKPVDPTKLLPTR
ncbi:peptidoglycan DD-metalloendopeptidase family protein [Viridibacterium curvum]|uniref:LysM domain-containing protein n=1 Tax=Viridibacterium curvum TaxID=1101404 RepID=A0ABP9R167_9RHOO